MTLFEQTADEEVSMAADQPGPELLISHSSAAESTFSAWVGEHQRSLLAFAQLVSGDAHSAEDLLQGALAKAYLKWARLSAADQSPHGYVRRIIVNDNASLWRRAWKRREQSTDAVPDRAFALTDEHDTIWAAVQTLPLRQRTVIALRFYSDLSVADTAAAMGCSTGAVKTHTSRAMAKLRESLTNTPEGDADA